jgi:inorganic pyrophosphatase
MARSLGDPIQRLMGLMFKAHPWHGVSIGEKAPDVVTAYIEIVPTDTVKYEVDKDSGFLKVDRPQRFSNYCPVYYGLVPQTFCGNKVAAIFSKRAKRKGMVGDGADGKDHSSQRHFVDRDSHRRIQLGRRRRSGR